MTENVWSRFKAIRIVDRKPRTVIVDICGGIINRNPTKEESKDLKRYLVTDEILKLAEDEKRKYLLEFLRYFYYKEGRTPTEEDFSNNPKYPSDSTIIRAFRSWNSAIIEAGLQVNKFTNCTEKRLLEYLIQFYEENGRPPSIPDFTNNPKYPHFKIYYTRFGNWQKSLKMLGLDIDSMARRGITETSDQKARLGESFVKDHFEEIGVIDLSGKNKNSPCDGICPKGYSYDVKTSAFHINHWEFTVRNANIDKIEWLYLLAFDVDYTELLSAWRIPTIDFIEYIEKVNIYIGTNNGYVNNLENMKKYDITEKIILIFKNWLDNIKKQDNTKMAILRTAKMLLAQYDNIRQ